VPAEIDPAFTSLPLTALAEAGLRLGRDYPEPIVDHAEARGRFLHLAERHLKRSVT